MELVILIGLQGAGKSSFYRARFAGTHEWISKDRMRNNRRPSRRQHQLIEEAFHRGRSVVVDNTNPRVADRAQLIGLGRSFGATIIGYYFESILDNCLKRNRQRAGKERIPDVALYATNKRLEPPSSAEGFDQLFFIRLLGDGRFAVTDGKEGQIKKEARET